MVGLKLGMPGGFHPYNQPLGKKDLALWFANHYFAVQSALLEQILRVKG